MWLIFVLFYVCYLYLSLGDGSIVAKSKRRTLKNDVDDYNYFSNRPSSPKWRK